MKFNVGDKIIDPSVLDMLLTKNTPLKSLANYARVVVEADESHFSVAKTYKLAEIDSKKNDNNYTRNVFKQDGSKIIKSSNNVHMIHFSDRERLKEILDEKYKNHVSINLIRLERKELKILKKIKKLNKQLSNLRGEMINDKNYEYPQLLILSKRKEDIDNLINC